jgi:hypothetical protein
MKETAHMPASGSKGAFQRWWVMLNEEGRPCTHYSPLQKTQRILYRVNLNILVGTGIFFAAWYGTGWLERFSGYDPVSKNGDWVKWALYWLAMIMKISSVVIDVIYVIISNTLTMTSELFLQVWELREEMRSRWYGVRVNSSSSAEAGLHLTLPAQAGSPTAPSESPGPHNIATRSDLSQGNDLSPDPKRRLPS